jgi:Ribosomal protein S3, C-terminal domain/Mitochondrial ribosomal protein (VAR1)
MGQKINPKIFRLGIQNAQWNFRYFERKKEESTIFNYRNTEIMSYLKKIFFDEGLILQEGKINMNDARLHFYASYYNVKQSSSFATKPSSLERTVLEPSSFRGNIMMGRSIEGTQVKTSSFLNLSTKDTLNVLSSDQESVFKTHRLGILATFHQLLRKNERSSKRFSGNNVFVQQLLECLSLYTNNKYHVFITLQNLNRGMSVDLVNEERILLREKMVILKRYVNNTFFKDSLNIIFIVVKRENSAELLAQFLAKEFNTLKRHNYFVTFFKRAAATITNLKSSKVSGIKIRIGGRFNGAPRAKTRLIVVGNVPSQTLNKHIDYFGTTSYTKNGTFGIKVWVNYSRFH